MATPLLVDCLNITTWLENRKKLPKDWYNYLKAAEQKLKLLCKDHQQYARFSDLKDYLLANHDSFHYGDVNTFTEMLLKTPWAQQKSLVFGYSNKLVKEWTNLQKYMKNKLVGLLSTAKFIKQSLTFDLPGIDKNIELLDNQLSNLKRKIDFNSNTIFQQNKEREKEEKTLEIKGSNIEQEIPRLVAEIPRLFLRLHQLTKENDILRLIEIYSKVCTENGIKADLRTLQYFAKNGDQVIQKFQGSSDINQDQVQRYKYKEFENWKPANQWQIQIQGGVSREEEQKIPYQRTMLSERSTRQQILYNLNELLFFFQATRGQKASKGVFLENQSELSSLTEQDIETIISQLTKTINFLNSKKLTVTLQLKASRKSYQLMVSKFSNYRKNIDHLQSQIEAYRIQIQELTISREQSVQKLRQLRKKVVQAKNECEVWLTQTIKRDVRITGQVNKLE